MSRTVLIIEDDPADAGTVQRTSFPADGLRSRRSLPDGETGLDVFAESPFDAVIVDVLLPRIQGFDLLPRLRKLPGGAEVPVIMVSGDARGSGYAERMQARHSIAAFLQKPVDAERLKAILRAEIAQSGADEGPKTTKQATETFREPPPLAASLQGDLDAVPFARVLGGIYSERLTGALMLRKASIKKLIYFKDGIPVFVKSNLLHECLGRVMVAERLISQEECDRSLARKHNEPHKRQGELLIEMGCISEHNLAFGLELQMQTKLFDLFSWLEGRYQFNPNVVFDGDPVEISMSPAMLIYEGASRSMSTESIRRDLTFTQDWVLVPSADPSFQSQALQLDPKAERFISLIDGTRSVEALIASGELAGADAAVTLYALICTSLVRVAFGSTEPYPMPDRPGIPVPDARTAALASDDEVTLARVFGGPRGLHIPRRPDDLGLPEDDVEDLSARTLADVEIINDDEDEVLAIEEVAPQPPELFAAPAERGDPLGTMDDAEWAHEIDVALDKSWASAIDPDAVRPAGDELSVFDPAGSRPAPQVSTLANGHSATAPADEVDSAAEASAFAVASVSADGLPFGDVEDELDVDVDVVIEAPIYDDADALEDEPLDSGDALTEDLEALPEADELLGLVDPDPDHEDEAEPLPAAVVLLGVPDTPPNGDDRRVGSGAFAIPDVEDWGALAEPLPEDLVLQGPVPELSGAEPSDAEPLPTSVVLESSVPEVYDEVFEMRPPIEPLPESVVFSAPVPEYYEPFVLPPRPVRAEAAVSAAETSEDPTVFDTPAIDPEPVLTAYDEPAESAASPARPVAHAAANGAVRNGAVAPVEATPAAIPPTPTESAAPDESAKVVVAAAADPGPTQIDIGHDPFEASTVALHESDDAWADDIEVVFESEVEAEVRAAPTDRVRPPPRSGAETDPPPQAPETPDRRMSSGEAEAVEQAVASAMIGAVPAEGSVPAPTGNPPALEAVGPREGLLAEPVLAGGAPPVPPDSIEITVAAPVDESFSEADAARPTSTPPALPDNGHEPIELDDFAPDFAPEWADDADFAASMAPEFYPDSDVSISSVLRPIVPSPERTQERERTEQDLADRLERLASLTHYEVLEIEPEADDEQIRAARAQLESQFHPDRWAPDALTARARRLTEQATLLVRRAADQLLSPEERLRYDRAIGVTLRPAQADPFEAEIAYQMGQVAAARQETGDAERQFRRAIEKDPSEGEYLAALAETLVARNALDEADTLLRRATDLSPRSRSVSLARARLHRYRSDATGAVDWYGKVLKLDPDCREAREFLAAQDKLFSRRTGLLSRLTKA